MNAFALFSVSPRVWGSSLLHPVVAWAARQVKGFFCRAVLLSCLVASSSSLHSFSLTVCPRATTKVIALGMKCPEINQWVTWVLGILVRRNKSEQTIHDYGTFQSWTVYFTSLAGSGCTRECSAPCFPPTHMVAQPPCNLGAGSVPTCRSGSPCLVLSAARVQPALRSAFQTHVG